jgi:hypothetical protein
VVSLERPLARACHITVQMDRRPRGTKPDRRLYRRPRGDAGRGLASETLPASRDCDLEPERHDRAVPRGTGRVGDRGQLHRRMMPGDRSGRLSRDRPTASVRSFCEPCAFYVPRRVRARPAARSTPCAASGRAESPRSALRTSRMGLGRATDQQRERHVNVERSMAAATRGRWVARSPAWRRPPTAPQVRLHRC